MALYWTDALRQWEQVRLDCRYFHFVAAEMPVAGVASRAVEPADEVAEV